MAMESAPLVEKVYNISVWMLRKVEGFPRSYRFTVGDRITATILEERAEADQHAALSGADGQGLETADGGLLRVCGREGGRDRTDDGRVAEGLRIRRNQMGRAVHRPCCPPRADPGSRACIRAAVAA